MKKIYVLLVIFLLIQVNAKSKTFTDLTSKKSTTNFFIENKGQWNPEVKFLAKIRGMNCWITDFGIVYDFYKIKYDESLDIDSMRQAEPGDWREKRYENARRQGQVVKMSFVDCLNQSSTDRLTQQNQGNNSRYEVLGKAKLETYYNYFIGSDSTKWASYVGLYKEIIIKNVYEGIDYRLYFDNGMLRYDLIIQPFADLEKIRMKYEGQDGLEVNENGELVIKTSIGDVKNQKIYAYQNIHPTNNETEIPVRFTQNVDNTIGFVTKNYDKSLALTIDPLIYSTFIGGIGSEIENDIKVNSAGEAFVTGWTQSADYPVTGGAYDVSFNGGSDVSVSKLDPIGSSPIYSTFIGGTNSDLVESIAIDATGAAYITGFTNSNNYPTTSGAFDQSFNGNYDVFVTKLNASGSSLIYSTFIGGSSRDDAYCITVDGTGAAYVTGLTSSNNYPTTTGAYDESSNGGNSDIFVTKLNANGSSLNYSTYIGGNNDELANWITLDGTGAVYVTGCTNSSAYPTTIGAIDESYNGAEDVIVTKLNANGSSLIYSTFIGSTLDEVAKNITIDNTGAAYITGWTESLTYPTSLLAYDKSQNGGRDIFVSKLNASGSTMEYSTFIGGTAFDYANSVITDITGAAYITGDTYSSDFPATPYAYDVSFNGDRDVIVSKLNPSGTALLYSTFIGGTGSEKAESMDLNETDIVYIIGNTTSPDFPIANAFDGSHNGSDDAFVTKLSLSPMSIRTGSINPRSYCAGSSISIPFTIAGIFYSENNFTAQLSDESGDFLNPVNIGTLSGTSMGTIIATIPFDIPEGYSYRVRVISSNPEVIGSDNGDDLKIYTLPTPQINDIPNPVCVGNTYEYTSYLSGGITNKWGAVGGTIVGEDNGSNVNILWGSGSSGTVTLVQTNFLTGCKDSVFQTITINPLPTPQITNAPNPVCAGNLYIYTCNITNDVTNKWEAVGGTIDGFDEEQYVNIIWGTDSSGIVKLILTNTITGCKDSVSQTIAIYETPGADILGNNQVCQGYTEYYHTNNIVNVSNLWEVENGTIISTTSADTLKVEWGLTSSGTVTLIRIDTLTSCSDTAVKEIKIKSIPIVTFIAPVVQVCLSDSAIMLDGGNPIDGTYSGNGVINGWFDPLEEGDYEIFYTYKDDEGCSSTAKDTIKVLPNPDKPTITRDQRKLISSVAFAYQWYWDSTLIPSATEKEFTPTEKGYYKVEITDENGCKSISDKFYYGPFGVNDEKEKDYMLTIKPNPFSETTSILLDVKKSGFVNLVITNLLGNSLTVICNNKYIEAGQRVFQFNSYSLSAGVYYCKLIIGNYYETTKMVVIK
ncbi:MAG: T9SS type A sorting domain-containing protein [Bacteroidetes bacterium]|nr:MAG: T9SS type A sorting domain-containing protein [Bacteroidota bacterium]